MFWALVKGFRKAVSMARIELSDDELANIEPRLSLQGSGPARKDDRNILNGIFFFLS